MRIFSLQSIVAVFLLSVVVLSPLLIDPVFADYRSDLASQLDSATGVNGADLGEAADPRLVAALLIRTSLGFLGIAFLVLTFFAGFQMMMARGDDEQVNKAKKTLQRAVLGIIVILCSYSITLLVTSVFETDAMPQDNFEGGSGAPFRQNENDQGRFLNEDGFNQDGTPVQFDPMADFAE